ncbi:hypothetical protein H2248_012325 [Termitomyces sp. 'cryptogamus']|nr:hypothetical protein H2248_012325 [Termitomyces sp. 'cryptogamus']
MQIQGASSSASAQNSATKGPQYPLLLDTTIVAPLKSDDILRAAKTFEKAFADDPIFRYICNARTSTNSRRGHAESIFDFVEPLPLDSHEEGIHSESGKCKHRLVRSEPLRCQNGSFLSLLKSRGNDSTPPKNSVDQPRGDSVTKLARRLLAASLKYRDSKMSELENRRRNEVDEKMQDAAVRTFGDRVEKMWLIEDLWTDTRLQGHGCGGALLDTATAMADWAGQSTWLQSSNAANVKFYAQHGFETVATLFLGEEDPSWHKQPVVVDIVRRDTSFLLIARADTTTRWYESQDGLRLTLELWTHR